MRPPALPHPNGVVSIDHLVAVSPSFERSVAALQEAGLDLRRIREEPTPAGAPRQAFFRLGREILEMVAEPEEVVEAKGGPERPVRFWGLALLVDDLDATVARMAPHAGEPRAAVQPGRRIATLKRSAGLAVPVALITREQDRGEVSVGELSGTGRRSTSTSKGCCSSRTRCWRRRCSRARPPGDRGDRAAGTVPEPARPHPRRAADPRDRHARRLQHDLAGARAAAGGRARQPRARSRVRRGGGAERAGGGSRRSGRDPGRARGASRSARSASEAGEPFDLVFIDADKRGTRSTSSWRSSCAARAR